MSKTKIEWTETTWNPVTGCSKVSAGCKNCYAEVIANRFWGERKFTDVQCHEDRLKQPLHWKKPRMVFVNSMSDLFHESVPFEFIDKVFAVMHKAEQHTFQILTKRPERALQYILMAMHDEECNYEGFYDELDKLSIPDATPMPKNIWIGVSVENQETADERIPLLLQIPAAVRFLSCEPLLGEVDIKLSKIIHIDELACECGFFESETGVNNRYGCKHPEQEEYEIIDGKKCGKCYPFSCPVAREVSPECKEDRDILKKNGLNGDESDWMEKPNNIHWVICGGESGHGARPMHPDWARKLRDDCKSAGVPYFFKQHGTWMFPDQLSDEQLDNINKSHKIWVNEKLCELHKLGKKASGRLLDGVEHNEFPERIIK